MSNGSLRVRLLGEVRATRDAADIALGPGLQRGLFTALALRAGRTVTRASLVAAVWGEDPPQMAMSNLYTYVSRLRRVLEPDRSRSHGFDVLVSDDEGYSLQLPEESIDSFRFEQLRQQGRRAHDRGDMAEARGRFDQALKLWRGTALAGVPGPFAERQRRHLMDLRTDTRVWRARTMLAANARHEAVPELTVLVRDHPLREDLRALLMLALYRSGRAAEAIEVFQDALAVLSAEAGTRPSQELRELHRRIVDNDPTLGDPAVIAAGERNPAPARSARRPRPRADGFVGRQDELGEIRRLAEDIAEGGGALLWMDGPSGVGKSELLAVGLADVEALGCQLYWATGARLTQSLPVQMVLECLGSCSLAGLAAPTLRMADDIAAHVERLCARSPVVLVLDNVHWADETTIMLALQCARFTTTLPLLLVVVCGALYRPPELDPLWQVARRSAHVMSIGGLPDNDVVDLAKQLLGARPGLRLWRCLSIAGGNAQEIRQIVERVSGADLVRYNGGVAEIEAEAEPQLRGLMSSIVVDRIKRLGRGLENMVRWSSLLGDEFAVEDIATVTSTAIADLVPLVVLAINANILVGRNDQLAFHSHLVRNAVYEEIPTALRETLRREVADVLKSGDHS